MIEEKNTVGNIIADARKKKKLTQQELAKLLNVSDKAVSAWETGKNYPDLGVIKNISKYLDIDLINLLVEKSNKSWKKTLKIMLIIIAIVFICSSFMTGIYFINNYNNVKVYEVKLDSKKYTLDSGLIISSPENVIFHFSDIRHNLNIEEDINISLYYKEDKRKEEIISKFNYDFLYYECVNEYIDDDSDLENFMIEISYKENGKNIKESIGLQVREKYSNDKLVYTKNEIELTESEERLKILLHNVGYKKSSDNIYVKEYDNKNITYTYDLKNNVFSYVLIEEEFHKNGYYNLYNNEMFFDILYDDYVIEKFNYNGDKVECELGKCKDSEYMINLLLVEYKKLK